MCAFLSQNNNALIAFYALIAIYAIVAFYEPRAEQASRRNS